MVSIFVRDFFCKLLSFVKFKNFYQLLSPREFILASLASWFARIFYLRISDFAARMPFFGASSLPGYRLRKRRNWILTSLSLWVEIFAPKRCSPWSRVKVFVSRVSSRNSGCATAVDSIFLSVLPVAESNSSR